MQKPEIPAYSGDDSMKNQSRHLALFKSLTGKTSMKVPVMSNDLKGIVGYWPSWAKDVRRR